MCDGIVGRLTMVKRSVTQTVANQLVSEYNKSDGSAVVVDVWRG